MKRTRMLMAVALLALAACGDDDQGARGTDESTSTTTSTPTTVPGLTNVALDALPPLLEPVGGVSLGGFAAGGMLIDQLHVPAGGLDLTPFFPDGWCQVPHWGAVLDGAVHVRYADGAEDLYVAPSAYFMRPGHTVSFDDETTLLEVSPEQEMRDLIAHVDAAVAEALATTTTAAP